MKKIVVGLVEKVKIKKKEVKAKIDTGADYSSIDKSLASKLELGPVLKMVKIRSVSGRTKRPVIEAEIKIKGRKIKSRINLANRKHMRYKMLIGRDILKKGFLIDPSK